MSQTEVDLWESVANGCRLEVDDVVHAAGLSGLKYQLKHANDEIDTHVAEVYERDLIARLGLEGDALRRSCADLDRQSGAHGVLRSSHC
jgi:hypothetical protein